MRPHNGDNYLPLMWRFYRSHRSTLFRLAHTLQLVSTTQDTSVLDALEVVLANEDRTGELLSASLNLAFASEQWQRTVLVRTDKGPKLARRHFEVCVFAALAAALKAGDVAVEGSDAYADYREQLLPWSECEPQVPEYCQAVELPTTAAAFVEHLREWLSTTARRVDAALPSSGQVVITDKGEPVLKREDLAQLSPYQTRRLKRFGDYTLSITPPDPFETDLVVPFPLEDMKEPAVSA